nr:DUF4214 domain-containing protein [Octadecabacter sp. B2R22]
MVWRDGGLDIFVTGETLDDTEAGRGITQLRVDDLDVELPTPQLGDDEGIFFGTANADQFVIEDSGVRQVVNDFNIDTDHLDFSDFDQFFDLDQLTFKSKKNGLEVKLNGTTIRLNSDDGDPILEEDFLASHEAGIWQIDTTALPTEALNETGTEEQDLLDGREGDDFLLAGVVDSAFDAVSSQIFRLYQATLDRTPDVTGLNNWADRLDSGGYTLVEVTHGFVNSPEFQKTYGDLDNEGFVSLLYENVLGRAPDATGLANWTARLDDGASRSSVVVGFSESAEFKGTTEIESLSFSRAGLQSGFLDDVFRLYGATLDRVPDEGGFGNWSLRLAEGTSYLTVVDGFTNSAEFQNTYGATDNGGFVELLYNNVLDRAPDETGLENWTTRLTTGEMSRAQVVQGFAQSTEFKEATHDAMTDWVKSFGTEDILSGGGGSNVLIGGIMSDTFAFEQSTNGHNVIINFEPWDVLSFAGSEWDSVSDIAQLLVSDGTNVIFEDAGLVIEFCNTTLEQILDSEFLF